MPDKATTPPEPKELTKDQLKAMQESATEPTEDELAAQLTQKLNAARQARGEAFLKKYQALCAADGCELVPTVTITPAGIETTQGLRINDK